MAAQFYCSEQLRCATPLDWPRRYIEGKGVQRVYRAMSVHGQERGRGGGRDAFEGWGKCLTRFAESNKVKMRLLCNSKPGASERRNGFGLCVAKVGPSHLHSVQMIESVPVFVSKMSQWTDKKPRLESRGG
jgi:hypothetical protein